MGYSETMCQLCGVSPAIARLRRADEPVEAAWSYYGHDFVDHDADNQYETKCIESSGCTYPKRETLGGRDEVEHVAGPGCSATGGYSGYRITLEEMKGCRALQVLIKKSREWKPEDGDHDFELTSDYFLTGVGDGSPDMDTLVVKPVRHGVDNVLVTNCWFDDDENIGVPFHPTCFDIFRRVSLRRFGCVDLDALFLWSKNNGFDDFFEDFPRQMAVKHGQEQYWLHEPGCEYLAANPIDIPGLPGLINSLAGGTFNINASPFPIRGPIAVGAQTNVVKVSSDPFLRLPEELKLMVMEYLPSKDLANIRLASRICSEFPRIMFRRLIPEDMPWFWEVSELAVSTDWFTLYKSMKFFWSNIKGIQNRRRIWKDVEEIVKRIEPFRV